MAAVRIQEVAAWVESMRRHLNDDAVVVFVTHGDLIAKLLNLLVTNRSGSGSGVGTVGGGKSADVNASAALSFQGIRNTSVSNVVRLTPVRFYIKACFFLVFGCSNSRPCQRKSHQSAGNHHVAVMCIAPVC